MTDGQTQTAEQAADQSQFDPLAQFVALEKRRRVLEAELKTNKEEAAGLSETLLEQWADESKTLVRMGGLTVFVAQEFHCWKGRGAQTQDICNVLKRHAIDIVAEKYNAASLKSFVRERLDDEDGEPLPADLADLLDFGTEPRLKTRLS